MEVWWGGRGVAWGMGATLSLRLLVVESTLAAGEMLLALVAAAVAVDAGAGASLVTLTAGAAAGGTLASLRAEAEGSVGVGAATVSLPATAGLEAPMSAFLAAVAGADVTADTGRSFLSIAMPLEVAVVVVVAEARAGTGVVVGATGAGAGGVAAGAALASLPARRASGCRRARGRKGASRMVEAEVEVGVVVEVRAGAGLEYAGTYACASLICLSSPLHTPSPSLPAPLVLSGASRTLPRSVSGPRDTMAKVSETGGGDGGPEGTVERGRGRKEVEVGVMAVDEWRGREAVEVGVCCCSVC